MSDNYDINIKRVIDDYYKCIGAFENCRLIYSYRDSFNISDADFEEIKAIKKGREEDLLSELGKVGEKAFKYILGLEILKIYPNIDSESFESFFKKNSALKNLAEKHGISRDNEEFLQLINYTDSNNQKAHNFDFWYSVIDVIMKDFSNKFKKFIEYSVQSTMLYDYCENENEFMYDFGRYHGFSLPFQAVIFPNIINHGYEDVPSLTEKQLNAIIDLKRKTIRKCGDIFTRFRYASNNFDNKEFNLDETYDIINNIITFINMIHYSNDNLDFDLDIEFAKNKATELSNILNLDKEEIDNFFSLGLCFGDLESLLFDNGYTYDTIKKLLEIGVSKNDLWVVMAQCLYPRDILYFNKIGITDYYEMRKIIDNYTGEKNDVKDYLR